MVNHSLTSVVFLPIFVSLVRAGAVPTADPCVAASARWVDAPTAHACELTVPFDQARSADTVEQLKRFLAFYSAQTYQLAAVDPRVPQHTDVAALLTTVAEKVAQGKYASDWEFNLETSEAFNTLNDGHTIFSPSCAAAFSWNLPLSIASLAETPTTQPQLYIFANYDFPNDFNATDFERFYLNKGIDARKYDGAKVSTIDGQDAVKYMTNLAKTSSNKQGLYGSFVDANTRFNRLVTRFSADTASGDYALERGRFAQRPLYPGAHNITFGLKLKDNSKVKITIPWVVSSASKFTDATSFVDANCKVVPPSFNGKAWSRPPITAVLRDDAGAPDAGPSPPTAPSNPIRPDLPSFYHLAGGFDLYQLKESPETAVLYMQQFEPSTGEGFPQYTKEYTVGLYTGLTALKQKGVKHLIIETSGNRGGYIAAGAIALWSLFPNDVAAGYANQYRDGPLPQLLSELAADPANFNISQNSNYFYGWYRDLQTNQVLTNNSQFMSPPVAIDVNGVTDHFSNWVHDDFGDSSAGSTNFTVPPFSPEDIIVISNSICASTCSVFSSYLYEQHGVKTASFEGIPTSKGMQFDGGVKGTQVIGYTDVVGELDLWKDFTANRTDVPGPLPIKGSMSANFRNGLSLTQPKFGVLEFAYIEADVHYQYTLDNWRSPQKVWEDVAKRTWPSA